MACLNTEILTSLLEVWKNLVFFFSLVSAEAFTYCEVQLTKVS